MDTFSKTLFKLHCPVLKERDLLSDSSATQTVRGIEVCQIPGNFFSLRQDKVSPATKDTAVNIPTVLPAEYVMNGKTYLVCHVSSKQGGDNFEVVMLGVSGDKAHENAALLRAIVIWVQEPIASEHAGGGSAGISSVSTSPEQVEEAVPSSGNSPTEFGDLSMQASTTPAAKPSLSHPPHSRNSILSPNDTGAAAAQRPATAPSDFATVAVGSVLCCDDDNAEALLQRAMHHLSKQVTPCLEPASGRSTGTVTMGIARMGSRDEAHLQPLPRGALLPLLPALLGSDGYIVLRTTHCVTSVKKWSEPLPQSPDQASDGVAQQLFTPTPIPRSCLLRPGSPTPVRLGAGMDANAHPFTPGAAMPVPLTEEGMGMGSAGGYTHVLFHHPVAAYAGYTVPPFTLRHGYGMSTPLPSLSFSPYPQAARAPTGLYEQAVCTVSVLQAGVASLRDRLPSALHGGLGASLSTPVRRLLTTVVNGQEAYVRPAPLSTLLGPIPFISWSLPAMAELAEALRVCARDTHDRDTGRSEEAKAEYFAAGAVAPLVELVRLLSCRERATFAALENAIQVLCNLAHYGPCQEAMTCPGSGVLEVLLDRWRADFPPPGMGRANVNIHLKIARTIDALVWENAAAASHAVDLGALSLGIDSLSAHSDHETAALNITRMIRALARTVDSMRTLHGTGITAAAEAVQRQDWAAGWRTLLAEYKSSQPARKKHSPSMVLRMKSGTTGQRVAAGLTLLANQAEAAWNGC